jgi:hypothetical protein
MKVYKLDKLVAMNTEYALEPYRAYIIEAIGTNDTAEVTATIDAKKVGSILTKLAPLRKNTANMAGILPLGSLFLVVPPDKTYRFNGTAGAFVRIKGKILELGVGEALPADYASRFANQHNEYLTCLEGTDVNTGSPMADGAEVTLKSITPSSIEEYTFGSRMFVDQVAAGSPAEAEGNLGVRPYLDGAPLDHIKAGSGRRGWDRMSMEIPNTTDNKDLDPFSLEDAPIVVAGDKTLEIRLVNVSGGSLFGTSTATFHWYGVAKYRKVA